MRQVVTPTEQIQAYVEDGIGWVILNRPEKHNAISEDMFAAMAALMVEWTADDEVRVVVVRGVGDSSFASGADMGELDQNTVGYPPPGARKGMTLVIPKPVIAMINGYAIGGGLMLAMDADIRVAAHDAVFGIPAAPLGAGYPLVGVQRLVALVGMAQAATIMFMGDRFAADTAERLGLVNKVVPQPQLEMATKALATRIAQNAPMSMAAAKAVMNAVTAMPGSSIDGAQDLIDRCWVSSDFVEGRTAFAEKRTPQFRGR